MLPEASMRTDAAHITEPNPPPPSRWTRRAASLRRWLDARGGSARWAFALAGLILVAVVAYFTLSDGDAEAWEPLYPQAKLLRTETDRITGVLYTAKITYNVDAKGIVVVPTNRAPEARNLLVKQKANPRLLPDVLDDMSRSSSWMDGPAERDQRLQRLHAEALEIMIREQPGIESSNVLLSRPGGRGAPKRADRATALVYLKTESGQAITQETVHAIRSLVTTYQPDIRPDAVTIQTASRSYLAADGSDSGARAQDQLKEERYVSRILERLKDIDGVRIFVTLRASAAIADAPAPPEQEVGVNTPLRDRNPGVTSQAPATGKVMVLVQVPISFYLDRYRTQAKGSREPAPEDLQPYVDKTEAMIHQAVMSAIPPAELDKIEISRIDAPGRERPAPVSWSVVSELRRFSTWWIGAAAAVAVSTLSLIALGGRWLVARRPPAASLGAQRRKSYAFDASGPSERVRELVRRDPEAAAGVLQRWIGAGGGAA
jgi:type III secretory pathway lipoprotein EscJ